MGPGFEPHDLGPARFPGSGVPVFRGDEIRPACDFLDRSVRQDWGWPVVSLFYWWAGSDLCGSAARSQNFRDCRGVFGVHDGWRSSDPPCHPPRWVRSHVSRSYPADAGRRCMEAKVDSSGGTGPGHDYGLSGTNLVSLRPFAISLRSLRLKALELDAGKKPLTAKIAEKGRQGREGFGAVKLGPTTD